METLLVVMAARPVVLSNPNIITAKILLFIQEPSRLRGPCAPAASLTVGIVPLISTIAQLARQGMLVGTCTGLTVVPLSVLVIPIAISVIPKVAILVPQGIRYFLVGIADRFVGME